MYDVMPSNFRYSCSFYQFVYFSILVLVCLHVLCCDYIIFLKLELPSGVINHHCWLWLDRISLW